MIETLSTYFIIIIPLSIFLITLGMKATIGKSLHEITYAHTALEVPIDLLFISVALTVTYITKANDNIVPGIALLFILLLIALISVLIWKYSSKHLINDRLLLCLFLAFINYNITIWPLIYIININL